MGDFSLEQLLQVAVVILFFVLPGLKSVAEAKKVERERQAGKPARRAAPKPEASGLDDWKRLLRGELPQRPPRPPAAPPSAPARPRPAPPLAPHESLERSLEGRSLEGQSLEAGSGEGRVGERPRLAAELAPAELSPGLSPELASQAELAGLEPTLSGDSAALGELAVGKPFGAAATFAPAGRRELPSGPGAWRNAVIAAEVLAPPLGLRGPWPGLPEGQYH